MDTTTLNIPFLEKLNACHDGIELVKNNNLEGYPLDKLDLIEGDYNEFVEWLIEHTEDVKFDQYGNDIADDAVYTYHEDGSFKTAHYPKHDHTVEFDKAGNETKYTCQGDVVSRNIYDQYGNKTISEKGGRQLLISYTYDDRGNILTRHSDRLTWTKTYDLNNNVLTFVDEYGHTSYGYDKNNNMISYERIPVDRNDSKGWHIMKYNDHNQVISFTNVVSGTKWTKSYDKNHNEIEFIRNGEIQYSYQFTNTLINFIVIRDGDIILKMDRTHCG
jgi:hypothetical protein